jgi:hypothetical protein
MCDRVWCVWIVLQFQWCKVVVSGEVFDGISRHGNIHPSFGVVPLKIYAAVKISSLVFHNIICLCA